MNNLLNYQAFIEKKNILTIKTLVLEIDNYNQYNNQITGELIITGDIFTENFENEEILNEKLNFSFEVNNKICDLKLDNFSYQIVEGRGIEIEFDFLYEFIEERCLNDQEIKESIVEEVNEKLDEEFLVKEVKENENIISESLDLPKTSRIVYKFKTDENNNRFATRSKQ